MGNDQDTGSNDKRGEITLDRHTIDSIKTYEVTEDQLSMVESGSTSNELNFSIALLSVFASFVVTLLITDIQGQGKLTFFWVATITTGVMGLYFALEHRKKQRNAISVFVRIRSQKSTSAVRDNTAALDPVIETDSEQSGGSES